jgi:transcriptional regulator with XRE-family HTH domain
MNEFTVWINERFIEWEKSAGRRGTLSAFARYIGVKQPSLSRWMNGDADPEGDNVRKLAKKFGKEVYIVLGISEPEEEDILSALPKERANSLREALKEVNEALQKAGSISEEEAARIMDEIMRRRGWRSKDA